jgi:Flp pilus assembly protein TadG
MRHSRRSRSTGQALTEFALVLPLIVLLLVVIFDLGRLVFAYTDITNAARSAARVAIVNQSVDVVRDAAKRQATALGLTDADVTVTFCDPIDIGCIAQVDVEYDWTAITPIIGNIVGPVTVRTTSRMPIERIFP